MFCIYCAFSKTTFYEKNNDEMNSALEPIEILDPTEKPRSKNILSNFLFKFYFNIRFSYVFKAAQRLCYSQKMILRDWLLMNLEKPYATRKQRIFLAELTNLTPKQVQNWFLGSRKRKWFADELEKFKASQNS